jgi:hypothetical protein
MWSSLWELHKREFEGTGLRSEDGRELSDLPGSGDSLSIRTWALLHVSMLLIY